MEMELIFVSHGVCRLKVYYADGSTKLSGKGTKKALGDAAKAEILRYLDSQENFKLILNDGKHRYDQSLTSKQIRELLAEAAA